MAFFPVAASLSSAAIFMLILALLSGLWIAAFGFRI
jgi:hypothetical protein